MEIIRIKIKNRIIILWIIKICKLCILWIQKINKKIRRRPMIIKINKGIWISKGRKRDRDRDRDKDKDKNKDKDKEKEKKKEKKKEKDKKLISIIKIHKTKKLLQKIKIHIRRIPTTNMIQNKTTIIIKIPPLKIQTLYHSTRIRTIKILINLGEILD